jgi:8-oxo-dGTP pyrophosphatase MutT (NUDIX family)
VISLIKERLKVYQAKEIQCPKSTWAGVIIPIFEKDGKPFIVLTKRTLTVKIHKGEVSFPGGMFEDKDGDRINTAIRECCEEIGVKKKDMEILGRLDDMFTLTGVCVRPYVGIIPYPYTFKANPHEVAYLIYLPLQYLQEVYPAMEEAEHAGKVEKVPSFYYNGDRIWGATCRILLRFKRIIEDGKI